MGAQQKEPNDCRNRARIRLTGLKDCLFCLVEEGSLGTIVCRAETLRSRATAFGGIVSADGMLPQRQLPSLQWLRCDASSAQAIDKACRPMRALDQPGTDPLDALE